MSLFFLGSFGLFLYFPEDKTEYIPAAFTMLVFTVAAFFAFRLIVKASKNEQQKTDELLKKIPDHKDNKKG